VGQGKQEKGVVYIAWGSVLWQEQSSHETVRRVVAMHEGGVVVNGH